MGRIGVNIPNELIKRLEPLKPEMNVSQICREAITRHLEAYERARSGLGSGECKLRCTYESSHHHTR